jgi:thiamine biosynthesis lipoprotein
VPAQLVADGQLSMGTVLELTLVTREPERARQRLRVEYQHVAALDGLVSSFDPNSALSRINAVAGEPAVEVDPRLFELLELAVDLAVLTQGSFDVTVGPLVDLWVLAAQRHRVPAAGELEAARELVGAEGIVLDAGRVGLSQAGMSIDLGGLAKGHALDAMVDRLRGGGFTAALLNFGRSSVRALGSPPEEQGWRLLLPAAGKGSEAAVLTLRDQALSVSSSLGQWSEIGGQRFGHVIDPRTGLAVSEGRRAVVVAPTAALAEALSTALVVLDPGRGLTLVESLPAVEARIESARGASGQTSGWQRATRYRALGDSPRRRDAALERTRRLVDEEGSVLAAPRSLVGPGAQRLW